MDNNKKLFEGLLKADGIDPTGTTESERVAFGKMFDEQPKSKQSKPGYQPDIWAIIAKSRIAQVAAAVILLLAVCRFIASDRAGPEQQATNGQLVAANSQTPAELMSVISLNMAFRDGGIEAMEKQFDKAEKRVSPMLKEQMTIEQLMCELEYCKEI